jgi:hypothetical protein
MIRTFFMKKIRNTRYEGRGTRDEVRGEKFEVRRNGIEVLERKAYYLKLLLIIFLVSKLAKTKSTSEKSNNEIKEIISSPHSYNFNLPPRPSYFVPLPYV